MIYVQHLLGIGHLQRSLYLAAELARQSIQVELVSGGMPHELTIPETVKLQQLPPVYSPDGNFNRLLDDRGKDIDDNWRVRRMQKLLVFFESFSPQVLITETFPFGRRMMRFELIPLLEAARRNVNCVQVITSIRDILQPKTKPGRNEEICQLIDQYYDHVLVHGDQKIARLADSFYLAARIDEKVSYSGYICAPGNVLAPAHEGVDEVLVSAGGSATGLQILKTAIAARPLSCFNNLRWRILVSPSIDNSQFRELQRLAGEGFHIERNRPDFSDLVKHARFSISQAGYNTITDILNSDTAAVVIPYAEADEVEQTMRAQKLQNCGRLVLLQQDDLSPAAMATAIAKADQQNSALEVNLAGGINSATMILEWLRRPSKEN
jgi:predicted glycosyltransferase